MKFCPPPNNLHNLTERQMVPLKFILTEESIA
jgi:hypothetical protein